MEWLLFGQSANTSKKYIWAPAEGSVNIVFAEKVGVCRTD